MAKTAVTKWAPEDKAKTRYAVAMNVVVMPNTTAEEKCRHRAGLERPVQDEPAAAAMPPGKLAPGLPRTPSHNLVFRGGRTIANLSFVNFYVGGAAAWKTDARANIDADLAKAMTDERLNSVMQQYFNVPITSQFHAPSRVLDGDPPRSFSKGDVEALSKELQQAGALQGFDLSRTVLNFMLPGGAELTTDDAPAGAHRRPSGERPEHEKEPIADKDDKASSLEGLGGYHGSVIIGGQRIYYAVGAFSEVLPNGRQNGIVAFPESWKNVVATFYHELNEARTDSDVEEANDTGNNGLVGWISKQGEEIGDFPIFEDSTLTHVFKEVPLLDNSRTVPIQLMYSNRVNGPEDPTLP
jgi:hypothetical protein